MRHAARIATAVLALAVMTGCGRTPEGSGAASAPAPSEGTASTSTSVARIVFVDQEQACDCTAARIEGSWTALQAALGQGSEVTVERIHRDTQEQEADQYRLLRPMVTVPGIYLLDEGGAVVELLQGEVSEEQLRQALQGAG